MFNDDLPLGELAEEYASDILEEYFNCKVVKSEIFDYDLITETGKRIEVKYDRLSDKTGNIAFEYESRGKPSGIKKSDVDYWCYIIGGHVYICDRNKLLLWFLHNHRDCKKVKGGDNNTSKLILLNKAQFYNLFTKI